MSILLSDAEINNAIKVLWVALPTKKSIIRKTIYKALNAQIKKIYEWLDAPCPHGTLCADTSGASRRSCDICWSELLKEVSPDK
jgi:hypothetical protein